MHEVVESGRHDGGRVAPGFEEVRAEFERNFTERGEIGAAVAVYWRGQKVVDLWGGRRTPTARAIARAYSALAEGGAELGMTPATLASLTAAHEAKRPKDEVMGVPSSIPQAGAADGLRL